MNIDGKEVLGLPGQTILEVARENDIFIPTLCFDERTEIYSLLVNRKANLSVKDMYGDTVLHIATMTEVPVPTLRILIDHGADVNARNKDGVTPLALAIRNNIITHAKFYAENNADINSMDKKGNTPLTLALKSDETILKTILHKRMAVGRLTTIFPSMRHAPFLVSTLFPT